MNILYVRVSTVDQNTDRQKINEKDYNLIVEDRCSGAIPFFDRPGGKEIIAHAQRGDITISVISIDRMGRDLLDVLHTIKYFTDRQICIHFITQGLRTLQPDGKENPISKLIISILGTVSEMERNQIKERTAEGIRLAKARGVYKGRKSDTKEDILTFLSKHKNKKVIEYLKKGYKGTEAAKLAGVHPNTVCKIKKCMSQVV